jgi:hypothetical protein
MVECLRALSSGLRIALLSCMDFLGHSRIKMEFEKLHRLPDNEFTEICSADMPDLDLAYHHWLQDRYAEQFKKWEEKMERQQRERLQ